MSTWYRAVFGSIETVEVKSSTAKFVTLANGRRDAKESSWMTYHETWLGAKNKLVERAMFERDKAATVLEHRQQLLQEVQELSL